jgi:hypothetical protein
VTNPIFACLKQDLPRNPTERGMEMISKRQQRKQSSSIRFKHDSGSNVTFSNPILLEAQKQDFLRISTERGTQIVRNEQQAKADCPSCLNFGSDSNVNTSSCLHDAKEKSPQISIERGTKRTLNAHPRKHSLSSRTTRPFDSNAINSSLSKFNFPTISTDRGMQIRFRLRGTFLSSLTTMCRRPWSTWRIR